MFLFSPPIEYCEDVLLKCDHFLTSVGFCMIEFLITIYTSWDASCPVLDTHSSANGPSSFQC